MKSTVITAGRPVEGSPYSPAIQAGGLIFVSGQVPLEAESGQVVRDDFERAVGVCLDNLERILAAAGAALSDCLKVTVYLKDLENFARLNAVYAARFTGRKPARTCIQVSRIPLDADVEIDAIAAAPAD